MLTLPRHVLFCAASGVLSPRGSPAITIGRVSTPTQTFFDSPAPVSPEQMTVPVSTNEAVLLSSSAAVASQPAPEIITEPSSTSVFSGAVAAAGDTPISARALHSVQEVDADVDDQLLRIKCLMCGAAMPIEDIADHAQVCDAGSSTSDKQPASVVKCERFAALLLYMR